MAKTVLRCVPVRLGIVITLLESAHAPLDSLEQTVAIVSYKLTWNLWPFED